MEAIAVEARLARSGEVLPVRLTWQGNQYAIESVGRRWNAEDGLHILVMAQNGRMFELIYVPEGGRWYLGRIETGPFLV